MAKITSYSVIYALVACLCILKSVDSLDCSEIIKESTSGVLNWLADVTLRIPVKTDSSGWSILMNFDQKFTGVGVWEAYVESNGTEQWARLTNREDNAEWNVNDEFFFRFRVNYGVDIPKPQVVNLKFQNIEMCK